MTAATANVAGAPVMAATPSINDSRGGQSNSSAVSNRRGQSLLQSNSVYVPSQPINYAHAQHMVPHYQVHSNFCWLKLVYSIRY